MAGLQSQGIGSGLDINSIVAQLMAIEQRPLLRLVEKGAAYQAEISSFGSLKSALSSLQSALSGLKDATTFLATTATSSKEDVLTATTAGDTAPLSFNATVNRLAQRHKLAPLSEFASTHTFGGTAGDELVLSVGTDSLTVDLSTAKTLTEIREVINGSDNDTGITALVITGDSDQQTLVLTGEETGYEDRIQLSYGGNINAGTFDFAIINTDANGQPISETELDASLVVDGVTVTRAGNSIADVIEGVTLELAGVGETEVNVTRDTAAATSAVQGFVSAHNALRQELNQLSAGELGGDSALLSVGAQIRSVLNNPSSGVGNFSYLQEVGVTTNENGDLQLDSTRLTSALDEDLAGLAALFADEEVGFAVRLDSLLERFVQAGGAIDLRVDGLNSRIDGLQDREAQLQRRLVLKEERLRAQFTALDGLVSQLQTTSSFLTQQLATLPGLLNQGNG